MFTRPRVYTETPDGTGRIWLDRMGLPCRVTSLRWRTTYPGGDSSWECSLDFDPASSHEGLQIGRKVTIVAGGGVRFQGSLDLAQRGTPWRLQGAGLAPLGGAFIAVDSSGNAYNLNNIIDQAIARGLPWTRPASLPTAGSKASGTGTIDESLAAVGKSQGQVWSLSAAGAITMAAPPTTPTYLLRASQALTPRVVGFTQAVGLYQSSSTATATVTTSNATAQGKWGKREGRYDMTVLGIITSGTASTYLSNWLTANLAQPTYTDALTAKTGDLRAYLSDATNGNGLGGPVDLSTVRAGCLVTVFDVDPDHGHLLTPGPLQVLVGETEYDADTDSVTLTPVGVMGTRFRDLLYQGAGGAL